MLDLEKFLNDERVELLEFGYGGDSVLILLHLVKISLKRKDSSLMLDNSVPYTIEMLAPILRKPLPMLKYYFNIFEQYGLIKNDNGIYKII